MSTPSSVSGGDGDIMQSSGKEDKKTDNLSLQSKSASDASLPPTKFDNLNSSLDIKENMMCTDDEIDDFLLAENAEEEKSSMNDLEQVTGSQESSESEELYLVLSDEGETDNPTDAERNCDEGNSNVNKSQVSLKEQSENIDSSQQEKDQVPFEETLTYDLHVSENHNNSECSTDSSDLLKMTTEEEMICPPVNDNILDEDDFKTKQQSVGVKSAHSSGVSGSASEDTKKSLEEQSVKSKVGETPIEVCKELDGGRLKDKNRVESTEESSNSNSSGSNTEPESRSVSEASLNKTQDTTDSRVSSPSTGQQQPTTEKSSATKDKSVTETSDVTKHVAMDISSTLPSGLFKDDSLEEFSLSPKDCQSLKGDEKNAGVEANGLNEAEQGLSIEDIIDNLSSPIEEDACSVAEETPACKSETEVKEPLSSDDRRASNKRAPDPDSLSNDKVEVKKVKLDIVFGDKTADSENSDETKNVTSSTISVDERESANVNGEVTKMEVCCDDDIDIIEEKPPEKKGENVDEKVVDHPDTEEKEMPPHVEEKLEVKAEVKVNGIATDHSDEDVDEETIVITSENVDELVIKRVSDVFYEDHINTIVTMMKKIETLERALEKSRKRISYYQNMLGNLSSEHRRQLAKFGFLPKVHTRTVGVNVRILQEHELQSTNRLGMVKGGLVPAATSSAPPAQSTPVLTNTTMQLTPQPTAKKTVFPRAATPAGLTPGPRMPSPNVTVSQITVSPAGTGNDDKIRAPSSLQIIPTPGNQSVASPAMMNRPRMQPSILRRQPVSKSPVGVASAGPLMVVQGPGSSASCAASSSSINVIDLTEDGDSSLTTTTAATSQSSAMLVSPSVTRGPSSNIVPMPLVGSVNSLVQLVSPGPHVGSSISGNSAIRVGRPPTVLPNSACLSQGPRVAYVLQQNPGTLVMPRMDGQVSQIGSLQPHQSPFVTSSGQHVPTIFVRMNAPPSNTAPVASSNVVSVTKSAVSQSIAPARTLPSGNPSSSTMLISCSVAKHPAPLPPAQAYPENKTWKSLPPKPALKISKVLNGIVLLWSMSLYNSHAEIASYQLFAYQESNQPVTSSLWKKVGDVKALPLPMACTLTQFVEGHKYHFAVRAVDVHGRIGPFSDPSSIVLLPRSEQSTATK